MWKVAAADDEAYLRTALKKLMNWEKMGCELIRVVNNGKELLQCVEEEHPDIVITDIRMRRLTDWRYADSFMKSIRKPRPLF